jgi:hypothetical protein
MAQTLATMRAFTQPALVVMTDRSWQDWRAFSPRFCRTPSIREMGPKRVRSSRPFITEGPGILCIYADAWECTAGLWRLAAWRAGGKKRSGGSPGRHEPGRQLA